VVEGDVLLLGEKVEEETGNKHALQIKSSKVLDAQEQAKVGKEVG